MSTIFSLEFESLISISSNEDSFYVLVSTLQSLYFHLKDNYSAERINDYLKLMAHLLENDLSTSKMNFLRSHLVKTIMHESRDEFAARYFQDRVSKLDLITLLKYHHRLTGNILVLTNIDYSEEYFKIKQVSLSGNCSSIAKELMK